jgi:hypothetical protein
LFAKYGQPPPRNAVTKGIREPSCIVSSGSNKNSDPSVSPGITVSPETTQVALIFKTGLRQKIEGSIFLFQAAE